MRLFWSNSDKLAEIPLQEAGRTDRWPALIFHNFCGPSASIRTEHQSFAVLLHLISLHRSPLNHVIVVTSNKWQLGRLFIHMNWMCSIFSASNFFYWVEIYVNHSLLNMSVFTRMLVQKFLLGSFMEQLLLLSHCFLVQQLQITANFSRLPCNHKHN